MGTIGSAYGEPWVDETNEGLISMNEIHANIHRGIFYTCTRREEGLANNGTLDVLVQVAAGTAAHIRFSLAVGGQCYIDLFENTTFSAEGTAMLCMNRNRFAGDTSTTEMTYAPTLTADGDALATTYIPGGTHGTAEGFIKSSFEEWILGPGNYLLRITNKSGVATDLSTTIDHYEA